MFDTGNGSFQSRYDIGHSELSNFGGGGGCYDGEAYVSGGSPFGGNGGGQRASSARGPGGGGGAPSNTRYGESWNTWGGAGGPGMISITFY